MLNWNSYSIHLHNKICGVEMTLVAVLGCQNVGRFNVKRNAFKKDFSKGRNPELPILYEVNPKNLTDSPIQDHAVFETANINTSFSFYGWRVNHYSEWEGSPLFTYINMDTIFKFSSFHRVRIMMFSTTKLSTTNDVFTSACYKTDTDQSPPKAWTRRILHLPT